MKKMKKVLSLVLALALVFGLSATAFAASSDDTTGSITINGAIANETYTIYQIFELTYTDYDTTAEEASPDSYSYKVVDGWEDFITGYYITPVEEGVVGENIYLFSLTDDGYLEPTSAIFDYEDDADVVAAFARAALAYATTEDSITASASGSFGFDETAGGYAGSGDASIVAGSLDTTGDYVFADLQFSDLSLGWYLVDTSLGSLCMLDSTDPNAVVNEKNSTPVISKHVYNTEDGAYEQEDHESNGTAVTYELDVEHITGAVNLVIHDSQPEELHEDWETFAPTVTLVDGESRSELTANEDYTIVLTGAVSADCTNEAFGSEHDCTFEIDFSNYDFSNVSDEAFIEVIYTATLETEGDLYEDDFDEIDNFAVVTFGTSTSSPVVEAEVYSFGFEVYKYTGDLGDVETEYGTYYVFEDTITHDGPADVDNDFYFVATDGSYEYYAVMTELGENSYIVTDWVDNEDGATSITEPQEETAYTIYVTESSMADLAALEGEPSVENLLVDARFHLLEEGGNASEQQDEEAIEYTMEYGTVPGTASPLANAVFEVSREVTTTDDEGETTTSIQTAYFLYEEDLGIYFFEGWATPDNDGNVTIPNEAPEGSTFNLTSTSDGMIYIEGLDTGDYIVTEIAAPDGYNLLDESIYVTIWAEYDETTGAIGDHGVTWTLGESGENESGVVNVLNNAGTELPGTGGIGTTWFYIIGAILVVGAAVVLVTRRRVNAKAA